MAASSRAATGRDDLTQSAQNETRVCNGNNRIPFRGPCQAVEPPDWFGEGERAAFCRAGSHGLQLEELARRKP